MIGSMRVCLSHISKKLGQDLKSREIKRPIVNQQCVFYSLTCDLCGLDYVGYTACHLAILNTFRQPMGKQALSKKANSSS